MRRLNLHRKGAKAQRKRKGKQKHLTVKSKEVDRRVTATYRLGGTNWDPPPFDTLPLVFSAYPLRLCVPLKGVLKRIFAVRIV
ncbi:MAG: hypothetical protein ACREVW_18455, partial [Burkholderiales bacterium]